MSRAVLGYLCRAFPPAVAVGLGLRPVRAVDGVSAERERAGEALVRPDLCPFVKSVLGGVVNGVGLFGEADAWAGMYTCDMTRRLFQELESLSGKPVFAFQLPATRGEASADWFAGSVALLAERLIEAGLSPGYDAAAALQWESRRLGAASRLRSAALSWSLSALELHGLFIDFFARNAFDFRLPEGGPPAETRVAVTGSSLAGGDDNVPALLDEYRAGYLPLGCTGLAGLPRTEPADGSPEALGRAAFHDTLCIRNRPNERTFAWLRRTLEESGAHGLVLKTLTFCDLWYTEKVRLREAMPVPVLVLDGDYSTGETGRTGVRLASFLETLEARRG